MPANLCASEQTIDLFMCHRAKENVHWMHFLSLPLFHPLSYSATYVKIRYYCCVRCFAPLQAFAWPKHMLATVDALLCGCSQRIWLLLVRAGCTVGCLRVTRCTVSLYLCLETGSLNSLLGGQLFQVRLAVAFNGPTWLATLEVTSSFVDQTRAQQQPRPGRKICETVDLP